MNRPVDQKLTELGLANLLGESGEPELITSQSAEDQRAHEEDA